MDGVEVSVMGWVINNCQCRPMHPSLMCEEQSCVYQSRCVLVSSINFMVLTCPARCGHCSRHLEIGIALGMMSLQTSHLRQGFGTLENSWTNIVDCKGEGHIL